MTAKVMELPGGPVLVGAVGVGVLVVAGSSPTAAVGEVPLQAGLRGPDRQGRTRLRAVRQDRLRRQGRGPGDRRGAVPVRRRDPRPGQVGGPRPGAAQAAPAALRRARCWCSWPSGSPATGCSPSPGRGTSTGERHRAAWPVLAAVAVGGAAGALLRWALTTVVPGPVGRLPVDDPSPSTWSAASCSPLLPGAAVVRRRPLLAPLLGAGRARRVHHPVGVRRAGPRPGRTPATTCSRRRTSSAPSRPASSRSRSADRSSPAGAPASRRGRDA